MFSNLVNSRFLLGQKLNASALPVSITYQVFQYIFQEQVPKSEYSVQNATGFCSEKVSLQKLSLACLLDCHLTLLTLSETDTEFL